MRRSVGAMLVLLLGLAAVWAQDSPKKEASGFKAIEKEFVDAQQAAMKAYREAKPEDRQKALQEYRDVASKFAARVKEYVAKDPKPNDVVDAWIWTFRNATVPNERNAALATLAKDHLNDPKVAALAPMLARTHSPEADKILRTHAEKGKDAAAQGLAMLSLAQNLKARAELVATLRGADEATNGRYASLYGADFVKELKTSDPEKVQAEAESFFDRVAKEFADQKYARGTLGDAAKGELFEIRNLVVGKTIPEIDGEDLDGVKFKISDYRGKVVLIDFWGHW